MGNVIDYIREYGEYSLLERPFCEADGLALAQFSYLKLDGAVRGLMLGNAPEPIERRAVRCTSESAAPCEDLGAWVTLEEIAEKKGRAALLADDMYAKMDGPLFDTLRASRRFGTMKVNFYVNRIDRKERSQFAAVSCLLEDGSVYIAFRGTDETLAGWREDLAMLYRMPVKSQELSAAYVNRVGTLCRGALYVGGHSKGGNLAVYAAAHCRREIRERIRKVYDLDGPGFCGGLCSEEARQGLKGRICKIVPHSSWVGLLLEEGAECEAVESRAFSIFQHNAFSWLIRDGRFVRVKDVYRGHRLLGTALSRRLRSLPEKKIERWAEMLFALPQQSGMETVLEARDEWRGLLCRFCRIMKDRLRRGAERKTAAVICIAEWKK